MDTTNNTAAVNLLGSSTNRSSEQDSSSTTNSMIDLGDTTSAFNLSAPIGPERAVISDKPLDERSVGGENLNIRQSGQMGKSDAACVNEELNKTLSSVLISEDGRVGSQRVPAEISLDDKIELSIKKAVEDNDQKKLDQLLQQHNVHGDTILTGNLLVIALDTAIYHDEKMAISLINSGVGIKYKNERRSKSGLATALIYGKHTVAEALLQKGANVEGCSYDTKNPLLITIEHGDLKSFELLLKYKPVLKFNFLRTALDILVDPTKTIRVNDSTKRAHILKMAKVLINAGVNIKVHVKGDEVTDAPAIDGCDVYGPGGINLNKDNGRTSVLCKAIDLKDIDLIKLLLDKGFDVHAGNSVPVRCGNPLHLATLQDNEDLIKLLLEYGADVNAFFSHTRYKKPPITPLAGAVTAQHKNMDIILLLVKHGAIVHQDLFEKFPTSMMPTNPPTMIPTNPPTMLQTNPLSIIPTNSDEEPRNCLTLETCCLNEVAKLNVMNSPNDWSKIQSNIQSLPIPPKIKDDLILTGCLSFNQHKFKNTSAQVNKMRK